MPFIAKIKRQTDYNLFPSSTPIVIDNGASYFRIGYFQNPNFYPYSFIYSFLIYFQFHSQLGWRNRAPCCFSQHCAKTSPQNYWRNCNYSWWSWPRIVEVLWLHALWSSFSVWQRCRLSVWDYGICMPNLLCYLCLLN